MYKFTDKEHTKVTNKNTGTSGIHPGVWMWAEYQKWVDAGGITEAFLTLPEELKERKAAEEQKVREDFSSAAYAPVTIGSYTFNGGFESAAHIKAAIDLSESLGETSVPITDINNVRRTYSYADAKTIVKTIGKAYRDAFFTKQDALVNLK